MAYCFDSELFSGPLSVLWQMIQNEKLDIDQISLANITDEYLSYIEKNEKSLSLNELNEFLGVATLLLKMKIRYITKSWQKWEEEDELEQEDLLRQLKLYDIYHKQILKLNKKFDFAKMEMFARRKVKRVKKINEDQDIVNVDLEQIEKIAEDFLGDWRDKFKKWQINKFKILDVKNKILDLNARLNSMASMSFAEMKKNLSKADVIANFLAILELLKQQKLIVQQDHNFNDLIIEKK